MAVLAAAAARGWQLADVRAAVASGAWKGLPALYERRSEPRRLERLLPLEWRKAIGFVAGEKNVRQWHTSDLSTRPPADESASSAEYGLIRQWLTAILCAAEDPERVKGWGRRAIAVRLVLLALGQAAMVSGSSTIEFGARNLALYCALSHRTVSRVLRMLRDEPDPLVDLVTRGGWPGRTGTRSGSRTGTQVASAGVGGVLAGLTRTPGVPGPWRHGRARLSGTRPGPARAAEVARSARLIPSATSAALRVLAEHGLAERGPGGWRRGAVALADVAESTGAADLQREREERYKQDREGWRARLRQYQGARAVPVTSRDGWWPLDDEDEYDEMCRWPVLSDDFVRGPPGRQLRESSKTA